MKNISDRLIEYLEYKGISKNSFYVKMGLSVGYLTKRPEISAKIIKDIIYNYTDINLYWLITGEGEMLLKEKKHLNRENDINNTISGPPVPCDSLSIEQMKHKIDILEEKIKHLEKESVLKDQIIQLLKNTQKQNDIKH